MACRCMSIQGSRCCGSGTSSRPTWPRQDHAGNRKRSHRHHAPCDTLLHSPPARAGSLQGMVARHQPCSCRCRHRSGADHRVHLHQSRDTCAGEVFILATARRVNAASTFENSVGIGEACHHVAYCRIMIAIIGKAEVAEPIWICLCHMPSRLRIRRSQNRMHHLHALCMPSCVLLMAYAWL